MMRMDPCMHELLLVLDKFCIMIKLLDSWVFATLKWLHWTLLFIHIRPFDHLAKWLRSCAHLWEFTLCVCVWINVRVGGESMLVEKHCILCRDIRVFIGLEKLEYNKRVCSCYLLCFFRMSSWVLWVFLLVISSHLYISPPWVFEKVYLRTSKRLVWGSWYLAYLLNFSLSFLWILSI